MDAFEVELVVTAYLRFALFCWPVIVNVWSIAIVILKFAISKSVRGNAAATLLLLALLVTVALATVKKLAETPVNVNPVFGVKVTVAVYTVLCKKVEATEGDQLTVPVNWLVSVIVVTGVCPTTGAVMPPIDDTSIIIELVSVNIAVTVPLFIVLLAVAPATVKKLEVTPAKVNPVFVLSVIVAV